MRQERNHRKTRRPAPVTTALLAVAALAAALGAAGGRPAAGAPIDWREAREHWAFRPPVARPAPAVRDARWPRGPIDRFILARLESSRLRPAPEATPRALARRLTFDLTGLPPTPEEVEAFVSDTRPGAYERLVDRLLASPRFGERMAGMWLPLARYAEDQAHQVGSDTRFFYPNAYRYREWVIDAFNRDLPYDQFLRFQIAADLYPGGSPTSEAPAVSAIPAAAVPAPAAAQPAVQAAQAAAAPLPPAPDLAALGFLGLGPKYYNRNRVDVMADEWQDRVDTVTRTFQGLTVACARCHDHKYDPITSQDYYSLAGIFASTKMVNRTPAGKDESAVADAAKMSKDTLHVVGEDKPQDLNVFVRGNVQNKGPLAPRRYLQVLAEGEPAPFRDGSGRRELAETLASPKNPLTARVMVNRLWGLLIGAPLVGTPSNFGLIGDRPTHPELLDWLALRFTSGSPAWSVKSLTREIVLSATYRQACAVPAVPAGGASAAGADAANRLVGHMNRRRLTVEQWRDAVLAVSGQLEAGGGPSRELDEPGNRKRTVYARISRLKLNDMLMQFDYPDANVHAEKRSVTTTPMQKLFMLNSPFILEQARAFAARLAADAPTDAERVRRAYLLLYARPPQPEEARLALEYLGRPEADGQPRWERYAQVLLVANEMLYLD